MRVACHCQYILCVEPISGMDVFGGSGDCDCGQTCSAEEREDSCGLRSRDPECRREFDIELGLLADWWRIQ